MAEVLVPAVGGAPALSTEASLTVSVVAAWPDSVWQVQLRLPPGATVADALAASGWRERWPDVDPWAHGVGIYGLLREPSFTLRDGDRVEVYRPLRYDPMESRRRRARHKAAKVAKAARTAS